MVVWTCTTECDGYFGRWMLRMKFAREKETETAKREVVNVVKKGMAEVEVKEDDTEDGNNWR